MKINGLSLILFCGLLLNLSMKCPNKIQTMKEAQFKIRLNEKINQLNQAVIEFLKLPCFSPSSSFIKTGAA